MKYELAALCDVTFGRAMINLLSCLPPYPQTIKTNDVYDNILIIKFFGVGSIIEATALLKGLKSHYPKTPIDILTFRENKTIFEKLGVFRHVHVINFKKGPLALFWQTLRFIFSKRRRYSLIIDLEFFANFSCFVTKMLASDYALGFESLHSFRNNCYSRTVIFDHSNHVRHIFLKFLRALELDLPQEISIASPEISDEVKKAALEKFPSLKKDGLKIAININASELCINRRWPRENFKTLIELIRKEHKHIAIFLIGSKVEHTYVASFYDSLDDNNNCFVTAGGLDMLEFYYLLTKMTCLVTSDSGPLHLAEAAKTPVIGFFGPETPRLYGPLSEQSLVFYENLFCSPCLNTYNHKRSTCRDNQCLKLIKPENVYRAMKQKFFK